MGREEVRPRHGVWRPRLLRGAQGRIPFPFAPQRGRAYFSRTVNEVEEARREQTPEKPHASRGEFQHRAGVPFKMAVFTVARQRRDRGGGVSFKPGGDRAVHRGLAEIGDFIADAHGPQEVHGFGVAAPVFKNLKRREAVGCAVHVIREQEIRPHDVGGVRAVSVDELYPRYPEHGAYVKEVDAGASDVAVETQCAAPVDSPELPDGLLSKVQLRRIMP